MKCYLETLLPILLFFPMAQAVDHHILVIIPSYNNENFCSQNLDTLFAQNYKNFDVVYMNDCSSDDTADCIQRYKQEHGLGDKLLLVNNRVRCGALRNVYAAVHRYCKDDDIVVIYDGDDFLCNNSALTLVNQAYQDPDVWLTYGNFTSTRNGQAPWCKPFDTAVIKKKRYRKTPWRFGPLRTFYAWLFKHIKLQDLMHKGAFFTMSQDQSWVYPLLEMADGRYAFIPEILYVYNEHNPLNDWTLNGKMQHRLRDIILAKKPYQSLQKKSLPSTHDFTIIANNNQDLNPADIEYAIEQLQATQASFACLARYTGSDTTARAHHAYLWDSTYAFQLGYKPQFDFTYTECAWMVYKQHKHIIDGIISGTVDCAQIPKTLRQKTGLLIMVNR